MNKENKTLSEVFRKKEMREITIQSVALGLAVGVPLSGMLLVYDSATIALMTLAAIPIGIVTAVVAKKRGDRFETLATMSRGVDTEKLAEENMSLEQALCNTQELSKKSPEYAEIIREKANAIRRNLQILNDADAYKQAKISAENSRNGKRLLKPIKTTHALAKTFKRECRVRRKNLRQQLRKVDQMERNAIAQVGAMRIA